MMLLDNCLIFNGYELKKENCCCLVWPAS